MRDDIQDANHVSAIETSGKSKSNNILDEWRSDTKGSLFRDVQDSVRKLELTQDMHERLENLVEKARDTDCLKGREQTTCIAALSYVVARDEHQPRTLDEISDTLNVSRRDMGRAYRYMAKEMDLGVHPPLPSDFVERFGDELQMQPQTIERALDITDEMQGHISGYSPTGIAAAALYVAGQLEGDKRTQKEVAAMCGVTEVTVRKQSGRVADVLDIDDSWD